MTVTDPAGDARRAPTSVQTPLEATANLDVTEVFFTTGERGTQAHLRVRDLSLEPPPGAQIIAWNLLYVFADTHFRVFAFTYDGWVTFEWETADRQLRGPLVGTVTPGPNGILSFSLPRHLGGEPGAVLTGVNARTDEWVYAGGTYASGGVVDSTNRGSHAVRGCGPVADPPPPPAGGAPVAPSALLPVGLRGNVSAGVANRSRRVRIPLDVGEPLFSLRATLSRGARVVARGGAGRLPVNGSLRLPLRTRLRPGWHVLKIAATRGDGVRSRAALRVRVR